MEKERKCEGGTGRLPIARLAVCAGSMARLLLTHVRLVEGERLRARQSEGAIRLRRLARMYRHEVKVEVNAYDTGVGWRGLGPRKPGEDPLHKGRLMLREGRDERINVTYERMTRRRRRTSERDIPWYMGLPVVLG